MSGVTLARRGALATPTTPLVFDPLSLTPAVWFKADAITGVSDAAHLPTWADSSGNGRDATQAVVGNQPTYRTGIQNGLPGLQFTIGNGTLLNTANLSAAFPTAGTVFIVATPTSTTYDLLSVSQTTDQWWRLSNGNGYLAFLRSPRVAAYPASMVTNTGAHVFAIQSGASVFEFFLDGVSAGAQAGAYSSGGVWRIGSGPNSGTDGYFHEVLGVPRLLSAGELASTFAYLKAKWGTP